MNYRCLHSDKNFTNKMYLFFIYYIVFFLIVYQVYVLENASCKNRILLITNYNWL